jgi:hypothetical protein
MRRRDFLGATTAAAVLASWPRWLRSAFADMPAPDEACKADPKLAALTALGGAWKRAHATGKPLLVLIIPAEPGAKYERGHAFGELLNHGTPDQLAPLALVEVACATMADLKTLVPSAGDGEPLMVLCETDRVPATTARLDAKLPEVPPFRWIDEEAGDKPVDPNVIIAQRIRLLSGLLRGGLVPDAGTITRRATQTRKRLSAAERSQVDTFLAKDTWLPADLADRGAALIYDAAEARQISDTKATALLHGAVKARLVTEPPAGSHWALSQGCGVEVEETAAERKAREELEKQGQFGVMVSVGCGMGHTPEKSQRFLYFFAVERPGYQ